MILWKVPKLGCVCPVSRHRFLLSVLSLCCSLGPHFDYVALFCVCNFALCLVVVLVLCQYQCKWLTGKTGLWYFDGDVFTNHSLIFIREFVGKLDKRNGCRCPVTKERMDKDVVSSFDFCTLLSFVERLKLWCTYVKMLISYLPNSLNCSASFVN